MGRYFENARDAKTVPVVKTVNYATGQVFKKGAVLVDDANGQYVECGADPASIAGVALQAAGTGPGYDPANAAEVVFATGRMQEVSMLVADRSTVFSGRAVNGGTDPVLPLQTHIGEQYGIAKVGNDWVIDMAETTAKSVEIVDIVAAEGGAAGFFLFKFLEAVLAHP